MEKARTLMEMTNPEAEKILEETGLAILPLGSVEQHGAHLPMGTDYYAAESFARRIAAITGGLLVDFCPFGVTPLHMGFGGTVSLRSETMSPPDARRREQPPPPRGEEGGVPELARAQPACDGNCGRRRPERARGLANPSSFTRTSSPRTSMARRWA